MKASIASSLAVIAMFAATGIACAADLKEDMKIQVETAELHAGMAPGTFVCAEGHFHIRGTVQNLAGVPVGQVKLAAKVFDADGRLLGTATASTRSPTLNPSDKAPFNLEFLKVTGPLIEQVKRQEIEIVAVGAKP
jgi:hypothetical protein